MNASRLLRVVRGVCEQVNAKEIYSAPSDSVVARRIMRRLQAPSAPDPRRIALLEELVMEVAGVEECACMRGFAQKG